ncbi:MAG: hypothetical protein JSU87_11620 [Gemmatimonadota bacterium]|nr:MAG: hypothetical protein JSU87_11620 [Gemmatimonadota bacterium]
MKGLGYFLITVGFLAGAFLAVRQVEGVEVAPFVGALFVGVVGIVLVRSAQRQAARDQVTLTANIQSIEDSLSQVAKDADRLWHERDAIDVYDLRHEIDRTFRDHLNTFVDARESIAHTYGLKAYSNVMSQFAAGERYLNRVWSASTDGYIDEAHSYLERARDQFALALDEFRALKSGGAARNS